MAINSGYMYTSYYIMQPSYSHLIYCLIIKCISKLYSSIIIIIIINMVQLAK